MLSMLAAVRERELHPDVMGAPIPRDLSVAAFEDQPKRNKVISVKNKCGRDRGDCELASSVYYSPSTSVTSVIVFSFASNIPQLPAAQMHKKEVGIMGIAIGQNERRRRLKNIKAQEETGQASPAKPY